jgi:uncharacterized protein
MIIIFSLVTLGFNQIAIANDECGDLVSNKQYYKAFELCREQAKTGEVKSQFILGTLYYQGLGVMADQRMAYQWIHKAAKKNLAAAQYNIGLMTANGIGSDVDFAQAYAWLTLAKNNGYQDSVAVMEKMAVELSKKEKIQAEKIVKNFSVNTQ